ncbi:MAG: hypothetical protein NFW16_09970 [Candidatus Accumulibacter sp.]|nr:hypothetical protein [Accumulibacter sp.]MCM8622042.1 hypothetical protein [Accumulibacter sp.]
MATGCARYTRRSLKKTPETDAIFANLHEKDRQNKEKGETRRLSMDGKATVKIGEYSRGGKTRGEHQAADHDMGCEEKYTPFGLVDEDGGPFALAFGSSAKTSDFIVDSLYDWWNRLPMGERDIFSRLQFKVANGPESSGRRTQFLKRRVEFTDPIGKPVQLLYYPPYHSKYNPVERCWGILEKHGNGAKLKDADTLLEWARSMTGKGIHPVVELSRKVYQKGVSLSKEGMHDIEARL